MSARLKSGMVAIVGRPNAGKSTLLNRALDARLSIVTPKAQTTRDRVLGVLTEAQGQIVFVDTPGIHRAKDGGINAYMIHEAREALDGPSVVWYVFDPSSSAEHEAAVLELLRGVRAPVFLLVNKTDMRWARETDRVPALVEAARAQGIEFKQALMISAKEGEGVSELLSATWALLPEGPYLFPLDESGEAALSDRPTRFFVAEQVREQLLMKLGEEVPYSCAVRIEKFEEPVRGEKLTRIEAEILVERDSQKGIVIGKGGAKIKEIGQAARASIEEFLGGPVFLGLKVKVLKDWSRDAAALKRLGYNLPRGAA